MKEMALLWFIKDRKNTIMQKKERLKCYCDSCKQDTWHTVREVLCTKWSVDDGIVSGSDDYAIIQCNGCDKISYRTESMCSENYIYLDDGSFEYDVDVASYPAPQPSIGSINDMSLLPFKVRKIYTQTLNTIINKDYILAGIGLRSAIEAICLDKEIVGSNLQKKIGKMVSNGLLSQSDGKMLQGIRFLGNDAAHEIDEPKIETIAIALKIIEHLLVTLYILPYESAGSLVLPIDSYDEFKKLLIHKIMQGQDGKVCGVNEWLGKDYRRIEHDKERQFEEMLRQEIDDKSSVGIVYYFAKNSNDQKNVVYGKPKCEDE